MTDELKIEKPPTNFELNLSEKIQLFINQVALVNNSCTEKSVKDGSLQMTLARLVEMYNHLLYKETDEDTTTINNLVAKISTKEELKAK